VIVDVLIAVSAHAVGGRSVGEVTLPVVFVKGRVAPWNLFALQNGQEGFSVHTIGCFETGNIQYGRRNIDVLDKFFDDRAGLYYAGTPCQKRHAHGFFVHVTFVDKPVLTEYKAIVAHVHYECVFGKIIIFEILDDPADTLVNAEQGFTVPAVKCIEVHLAMIHMVYAVPTVALLFDPIRFALVVFFGISHALWILEFDFFVFTEVPLGRFEHGVNGFMRKVQHERLVRVTVVFDPVQRVVREQVGDMALAFYFLAVDVKNRIEIDTLASKADPLIETGPGFVAGNVCLPARVCYCQQHHACERIGRSGCWLGWANKEPSKRLRF